jgi:predicted peroxiredoxin
MAESKAKRILYVVKLGPRDAEYVYSAFYNAALGAVMEMDTTMYFLGRGPELLRKGTAENIPLKEKGNLKQFIDMAINNGVKFMCCELSLTSLCEMKPEELIDNVQVVGAATLNDIAIESNAVISY